MSPFAKLWAIGVKAPVIILSTMLFGTVSVATSFFDANGRKQHAIASSWARWLLTVAGARVRVRGLENLQPGESYIFAGNHLSLYDTPVVLGHIPRQFLFLVNIKYVRLPFLGTHLRRAGHFGVDSEDMRSSMKIMTEAARVLKERGLSVLLFPEGKRSRAGLDEFKEGAAYMAIKSGASVVPFALKGTREVLPIDSMEVRGGPVEFLIGKPIPVDGLTLKDRETLTSGMRHQVAALLSQLDSEESTARQ
jgi:1-acyl-sn-glycerol-3-phosphate acyltransferase